MVHDFSINIRNSIDSQTDSLVHNLCRASITAYDYFPTTETVHSELFSKDVQKKKKIS
jgi:hypothetical protein